MIEYPTNIIIEYTNTSEYRKCIRKLFNMNKENYEDKIRKIENHNDEILDDETRDEISYDDDSSKMMLEYLFKKTQHIEEFSELYKKAAARMFSIDETIGQAILFSYDYLYNYHCCLVDFFNGVFNKNSDSYKVLVKKLS
jgi:hypothetical protein